MYAASLYFQGFLKNILLFRYICNGTNSLPFFKIRFYNLDVSTGNNPIRHGQLNTMISLDVRNSYALRRAADAPGSVGQTQRR